MPPFSKTFDHFACPKSFVLSHFFGKKTENDCLLISRANTHMNYSYLEKKLRFAKCQVYCQVFKPILVQTASKGQSFQTCIMYFLEFPLTPLAFLALVV